MENNNNIVFVSPVWVRRLFQIEGLSVIGSIFFISMIIANAFILLAKPCGSLLFSFLSLFIVAFFYFSALSKLKSNGHDKYIIDKNKREIIHSQNYIFFKKEECFSTFKNVKLVYVTYGTKKAAGRHYSPEILFVQLCLVNENNKTIELMQESSDKYDECVKIANELSVVLECKQIEGPKDLQITINTYIESNKIEDIIVYLNKKDQILHNNNKEATEEIFFIIAMIFAIVIPCGIFALGLSLSMK